MGKNKFNAQQKAAIASRNGRFLVAAGAGSGKTAVLSERIYQIVKEESHDDYTPLDNMLILTFTNKAAGEMKDRIRKKIEEDPETRRYSPNVESAMICTFDSFAYYLVNKYRYDLGIDEQVAIGEKTVFEMKLNDFLKEEVDARFKDAFEGNDQTWEEFVQYYLKKNDASLYENLNKMIDEANKSLDPIENLEGSWTPAPGEEGYEEITVEFANKAYDIFYEASIQFYVDKMINEADNVTFYKEDKDGNITTRNLIGFANKLFDCNDYDSLREYLISNPLSSYRRGPNVEIEGEESFDFIKSVITNLKKKYFSVYKCADELTNTYLDSVKYTNTLLEIAKAALIKLNDFKKRYSYYDFPDIFRMAYSLICDKKIGKDIAKQYKYIMVDEYQDTSILQQALLDKLDRGNMFFVGDIKQSIYSFRNAEPSNFNEKMDKYEINDGGELISLPANYRSRESVLNDINSIFERIMSKKCGMVDYLSPGQALKFGNTTFSPSENKEIHGLTIYQYKASERIAEDEGKIITNDIKKRIEEGFEVYDSELKRMRPCTYKDFAIIARNRRNLGKAKKMLSEAGIPTISDAGEEEGDKEVIVLIKDFILLLAHFYLLNPEEDKNLKKVLTSIYRSYAFQYKDEDIYHLIKEDGYLNEDFYKWVENNHQQLIYMRLSDAILEMINKANAIKSISSLGKTKVNAELIIALLKLIESYEKIDWYLPDIAEHFELKAKKKIVEDFSFSDDTANAVRLITIHSSKGLQYKIIYFADLGHGFNFKDSTSKYLFSSKNHQYLIPSPDDRKSAVHLITSDIMALETRSEEMRLLYVALTRAEEIGILLLPDNHEPKNIENSQARNFLDFLFNADFTNLLKIKKVEVEDVIKKENLLEGEKKHPKFFDHVIIFPNYIEKKKASKTSLEPPNYAALRYGERLHRLLELTDLSSKDTSFIKDEKERRLIDKVLNLEIFDDVKSAKAYKEYSYFDEINGSNAIIDLFLLYDDHIDLVDYKSSNIDDPSYDEQLRTYERYLSDAFHLPINKYLLSIKQVRIRKVD